MLHFLKEREIKLMRDGDQICALIGRDLQQGRGGFGSTVPEALRDLAQGLETDDITVWVPRKGKQYIRNGVLNTECPECGHVKVMPDAELVYMYICPKCGEDVELELPGSGAVDLE